MPLRDYFHPPLDKVRSWSEFHGQWPAMIVLALGQKLPNRNFAGPDLPSPDVYEVLVYDTRHGRQLVAAVEIVSPANKDRPDHRAAFVARCAALLQNRVSVCIVDLVTTRHFNLYHDLLELIGQTDPSLGPEPPAIYAVACRGTKTGADWLLEIWNQPLTVGQPLPTLPLWLADNLAVLANRRR